MFVSVQMFSYICRWACVNCSKNTLFTVKSQQCDIKFLQDLHYISKKKKKTWLDSRKPKSQQISINLRKSSGINTHTRSQQQIQPEH